MPRKRNLILDAGLDRAALSTWPDLFANAAVGTGTNPVKRDSGAVTFSRAGDVVTASAGFFEAGDVGRLIKWDTGEEDYISAFTSGTEVQTIGSGTIAAAEGTIWYVDRTALQTETKRSNTYGTDTGDNGTTFASAALTHKRTFIFSEEVAPITYNEIGWSWTATPGANLFGMDLISGGVSLLAGQKLKVIVELTLDLSPAASTPWSNVITGWSQDGDCSFESVPPDINAVGSFVQASGATSNQTFGRSALEPSHTKVVIVSTLSDALVGITASQISTTGGIIEKLAPPASYITGSFSRDFTVQFTDAEANSTAIRSLILGQNSLVRVFRVLLDAPETKDSDHSLSITFTLTWGRVLVN
ncbi:MAG: hypothetical protein H3C27_08550 [Opitutaceae bacterium]|nr:hypothetical protein [Opitutaceae bacterium]